MTNWTDTATYNVWQQDWEYVAGCDEQGFEIWLTNQAWLGAVTYAADTVHPVVVAGPHRTEDEAWADLRAFAEFDRFVRFDRLPCDGLDDLMGLRFFDSWNDDGEGVI